VRESEFLGGKIFKGHLIFHHSLQQ
jgi:hypothetical protein